MPVSLLPLSAVSWQEAIKYMVLDRVTVLEWYDDWVVSSTSWETRVPAVMMVKDYIQRRANPRFNKFNLLLRDRFTCQYCDVEVSRANVTFDHVVPLSKGGKTNWKNIVASCMPCNSTKGSKDIRPRRAPYEPTYYELVNKRKRYHTDVPHDSWRTYIES